MSFIYSMAMSGLFALMVGSWLRLVWLGFTMWGPL